jgi:hypothetical protein
VIKQKIPLMWTYAGRAALAAGGHARCAFVGAVLDRAAPGIRASRPLTASRLSLSPASRPVVASGPDISITRRLAPLQP